MATESQVLDTVNEPRVSSTHIQSSISLNIWPPSQRTRDAVINRLIQTLTDSTSIVIKRHGDAFPHDVASSAAADIEKEAYAAADSDERSKSENVEAGIELLGLYSKEISRRMIDFVKANSKNADGNNELNELDENKKVDEVKEAETGAESVENEASTAAA